MGDETGILIIVEMIALLIIIVLTLIYILPIIFIRRFHTVPNILTGNVCLAAILCCSYWVLFYILFAFYPMIFIQSTIFCSIIPYVQTMFNCLIIYALTMITINRFFTIIYPQKRLFKRLIWSFISAAVQWLVIIILPLPNFTFLELACLNYSRVPFWLRFYNFFIVVIFPSIINVIFNFGIFLSVRSSTRRVQASTTTSMANANHRNARDIYLLKHMLFICTVFVVGWLPVYILSLLSFDGTTSYLPYLLLQFLPECASLVIIIDLFWYNHDLRNYLKDRFLHCNI